LGCRLVILSESGFRCPKVKQHEEHKMKSKQRLKWILLGLMLIAFAMGSLCRQSGE